MKTRPHRLVALAVVSASVAVVASGCASTTTHEHRASTETSSHVYVQGPHVATGTPVRVRLVRALDLSSSTDGGTFDGVVQQDLRTPQGTVLIRSGASVHGRVVWSSRSGHVALRDAMVESPVGPLAVHGVLQGAGQPDASSPSSSVRSDDPDPSRASVPLARQPGGAAPDLARGRVESDTELTVRLTQPILAPNAQVLHE